MIEKRYVNQATFSEVGVLPGEGACVCGCLLCWDPSYVNIKNDAKLYFAP